MLKRSSRRLPHAGTWLSAVILALGVAGMAGADPRSLYVQKDKSELVGFPKEPFTRVSVTNPAIADVVVVTPTQLLVSGKGVGVTSLVVFYQNRIEQFELVVQPSPAAPVHGSLVPDAAHSVVVQRAGKASRHLFVPDTERVWVELGAPELEVEAPKK